MYARSTTVNGDPKSLDDAIAYVRDEVMPIVQEMDGCIGLSMLCDRDSGRSITTSAWETEEAMHNSESPIHDMRAALRRDDGRPAGGAGVGDRRPAPRAPRTGRRLSAGSSGAAVTRWRRSGSWTPSA